MNLLACAGITQCINFYSIQDNQIPSEVSADKDFFVGPNMHITLTIPNGKTLQVRDVVVLGKLSIQLANPDNSSEKGTLVANNIFFPGILKLKCITIKFRILHQPRNIQVFKKRLEDIIIDWFEFQRESAEKIGLKSIL